MGAVVIVADTYRGRREALDGVGTGAAAQKGPDADPVRIVVDDTERRRSRFRTTSVDGQEVGVTVNRTLRDGDVLDADGTPVVVELEPIPALAVSLETLDATEALAFGHALGNRHRDLTVEAGRALVPIRTSDADHEAELRAELPAGVAIDRTTVPPSVFDEDDGGHTTAPGGGDETAKPNHTNHEHQEIHGHPHRHDHLQDRDTHDHGEQEP